MPIMSRRLDEDDEDIIPSRRPIDQSAEREVSLGTGAILGLFFGLVLLLGAFFGFGYKLGSSTSKSAVAAGSADSANLTTSNATISGAKPSAGSLPGATPNVVVKDGSPALTAPAGVPAASARTAPAPPAPAVEDEPLPSAPIAAAKSAPASAPASPMPQTSASGTFIVQVAAVSHQEDADLLVSALHSRGYTVSARTEAGDRLVHIQVGPFGTKKDAEAMKARLTADGYNAYIK